ncbi:MAG: amino acid--tRNA ligase-related protein [Candidatus Aenigmatarchaeota archaeon]
MNFEKIALAENKERVKIFKTKEMQAIIKIESAVLKGIRNYFEKEGFVEIVVPHITKASGSCENILTLFELNYFGKELTFLKQDSFFLK